jgi:hypothetical protein
MFVESVASAIPARPTSTAMPDGRLATSSFGFQIPVPLATAAPMNEKYAIVAGSAIDWPTI